MPALLPVIAVLLLAEPLLAATPDEVAAARKEADALIASTASSGQFENVTESQAPAVRHLRSGLVCRFPAGSSRRSLRPDTYGSLTAPGDSVGCRYADDGQVFSLYAVRLKSPISPRQDLDEALLVMAESPTDAPYRGLVPPIRFVDGDPAGTLTGERIFRDERGGQKFVQVTAGRVGDWNYRLWAAGSLAKDQAVLRQAGELWGRVMLHIVHRPGRD